MGKSGVRVKVKFNNCDTFCSQICRPILLLFITYIKIQEGPRQTPTIPFEKKLKFATWDTHVKIRFVHISLSLYFIRIYCSDVLVFFPFKRICFWLHIISYINSHNWKIEESKVNPMLVLFQYAIKVILIRDKSMLYWIWVRIIIGFFLFLEKKVGEVW